MVSILIFNFVLFLIFQSLSYIDLNVRTLDGRLPEEMTKDTAIQQLLKKSRAQEPEK